MLGVGRWVLALALCVLTSRNAAAGRPNTQYPTDNCRARLVVVVANRLNLSDLDDPNLPNITRLLELGSVGLVSPNCQKPRSENAVLMTASAGASCSGGSFVQEFYDAHETVPGTRENALAAYEARTGRRAPPASAVFLGLGQAARAIGEDGRPAQPGLIGDALNRAGMKTCVVGNADLDPQEPNRAASVLATGSHGLIDVGRLTAPLGPTDACGFATSADGLAGAVIRCMRDADLVVVNFGDSTRLDEMKISLSDAAYARHRAQMLRRLDALLGWLMAAKGDIHNPDTGLILVSWSPPRGGYWSRLTPIVVCFHDKHSDLLCSSTTRTPGLIAATDFPALVLKWMKLNHRHLASGTRVDERPGSTTVLREMDARVNANHTLILPMLWVFAGIGALSLTVTALLIAFRRPISRRLSFGLRLGLLVTGCACLAMLLAALGPPGVAGYAVTSLSIALIVGLVTAVFARSAAALIVFGLTVLAIIADALTRSSLCKFALPSSYQLGGFRYYGIGNEYGAALVSMSALLALFSPESRRAVVALELGLVAVIVLGTGSLGGNYGATAAAVVTFGLILVALRKGGFRAGHVVGVVALAGLVSVAFAYADWRISGAAGTHGARIIGVGLDNALIVAGRKALMNARIASSHTAQQAFAAFVPFLVLWFWGIQPKIREMLARDDRLIAGLKALVVGSVAALVMNDSGIVMAGIMISMTVLALVYALLRQETNVQNRCA